MRLTVQLVRSPRLVLDIQSTGAKGWSSTNGFFDMPVSMNSPFNDQGIIDRVATRQWCQQILSQVLSNWSWRQPRVWLAMPATISPSERVIWSDIWSELSAEVQGIFSHGQASSATATGLIAKTQPVCVVHVGAATVEMGIFDAEKTLTMTTHDWGQHYLHQELDDLLLRLHQIQLSRPVAEHILSRVAQSITTQTLSFPAIRQERLITESVNSDEILDIFIQQAQRTSTSLRSLFHRISATDLTPILEQGVIITGPGASVRLMHLLAQLLACPVIVPAEPHRLVVQGLKQWSMSPAPSPSAPTE